MSKLCCYCYCPVPTFLLHISNYVTFIALMRCSTRRNNIMTIKNIKAAKACTDEQKSLLFEHCRGL